MLVCADGLSCYAQADTYIDEEWRALRSGVRADGVSESFCSLFLYCIGIGALFKPDVFKSVILFTDRKCIMWSRLD